MHMLMTENETAVMQDIGSVICNCQVEEPDMKFIIGGQVKTGAGRSEGIEMRFQSITVHGRNIRSLYLVSE